MQAGIDDRSRLVDSRSIAVSPVTACTLAGSPLGPHNQPQLLKLLRRIVQRYRYNRDEIAVPVVHHIQRRIAQKRRLLRLAPPKFLCDARRRHRRHLLQTCLKLAALIP